MRSVTVGGALAPSYRCCALPSASNCAHRGMGFTTAVRGTQITLPLRKSLALQLRGPLPIQAFISPAVLKALQLVATRAGTGKLLVETTRRGGMRLGGPVVVAVLLTYSVAATLWAARETARAQALESGFSDTEGQSSGREAAPTSRRNTQNAAPCPMCGGAGKLAWRARDDMPCPKCLGSGTSKPRRW
jgi:hypothetical protein